MNDSVAVGKRGPEAGGDDEFPEEIPACAERCRFLPPFFLVWNRKGTLDVCAARAVVDDEIDFPLPFGPFASCAGRFFDESHVNGMPASGQFVVDDVLHQVRFFVLAEVQTCALPIYLLFFS